MHSSLIRITLTFLLVGQRLVANMTPASHLRRGEHRRQGTAHSALPTLVNGDVVAICKLKD